MKRYLYMLFFTCGMGFGTDCFESQNLYMKFECEQECQSPTLNLISKEDSTTLKLDGGSAQVSVNEDFFSFTHKRKTYILSPSKAIFSATKQGEEPFFAQIQPISCAYVDGQRFSKNWADISTFGYTKQILKPAQNNAQESAPDMPQAPHTLQALQTPQSASFQGESYTISVQEDRVIFHYSLEKDGERSSKSEAFFLKPLNSTQAYITQVQTPECGIMIEKRDTYSLQINPFLNKSACEPLYTQGVLAQMYYKVQPSFECAKAQSPDEIAICQDPALAKADRETLLILESTKDRAQEYIAKRQECQSDAKCLKNVIAEFSQP